MGGFLKSLRFRILLILVLLGTIPGIVALRVAIGSYEKGAITTRTESVRSQCTAYVPTLLKAGFPGKGKEEVQEGIELLANVFHGRILACDRDFRIVLDTYHLDEGKFLLSPLVVSCAKGQKAERYVKEKKLMEVAVPIVSPLVEMVAGYLLISSSSEEVSDIIRDLEQKEITLSCFIVLIVVVLAYFLSLVLMKPFAQVSKSIEDLTDGYHDGDISVTDYTETALITDAFNRLLSRMKVLDNSRNEFVSNVSHELKTPMTSMKVLADSLVGQSGVPEELYQEFLTDITKEIDRENRIISDLLSLVKLDKRVGGLQITHVNVNECVEMVLRRLRPIADQRSISLFLDSFRPVEADLDEIKFTSALMNLVENAIKYNVDDGWVRVTINADHQFLFLIVADSGMGIPKEAQELIFERFYRVDKSHSQEIGGTGLGLAIVRSVVQAHQGTIQLKSNEGEGSSFALKIPLTYIPPGGVAHKGGDGKER